MAYGEQLSADSASKKFEGVLADNGAAANVFVAKAGANYRDQNAEKVADEVVQVTTTGGAGATIGTTTDAAASSTVAEDATGRTAIGLLKGSKNILILIKNLLAGGLPATLGQKPSATSLAVVPANQQFTCPVTRIVGDGLSHELGYSAAGATLGATADTQISAFQDTFNGGAYDHMAIGAVGAGSARRGLIAFDLADFALNTIATATLRLCSIGAPSIAGTLQAYPIKPANAWVEGAKAWLAADGTDPSWAKKSQTPDVAWAGAVGLGTAGTDYDAASLGILTWTTDADTWFAMTMTAARLQPVCAANHGFLLIADDEATATKYIDARPKEDATPAKRPELIITIDANQKTPKRVLLMANGAGATWVNDTAADANDAPIPTSGIEVPYLSNDDAALAVYVPIGVSVWFAGIGYE